MGHGERGRFYGTKPIMSNQVRCHCHWRRARRMRGGGSGRPGWCAYAVADPFSDYDRRNVMQSVDWRDRQGAFSA